MTMLAEENVPEQCVECLHNPVCGYLPLLLQVGRDSPLDLSGVPCEEYLSEDDQYEEDEPEQLVVNAPVPAAINSLGEVDLYKTLIRSCSAIVEQGYKPMKVHMNAKTRAMCMEQLAGRPWEHGDSVPAFIDTPYGQLVVTVDNGVPDNKMLIATVPAM